MVFRFFKKEEYNPLLERRRAKELSKKAKELAENGKFDKAIKTVKEITKLGYSTTYYELECYDALKYIVWKINQSNINKKKKSKLLDRVVSVAKMTIDDLTFIKSVLEEVIKGFIKIGELDKAIEIAKDNVLSDVIKDVAMGFEIRGDLHNAIKIYEKMGYIWEAERLKKHLSAPDTNKGIPDTQYSSIKKTSKKKSKSKPKAKAKENIQNKLEFPSQLLSKYEPLKLIGHGGFAKVFKCKRKEDGQIVAVKIPIESEDAGKSFVSEISNWKKLSHNNIVKLYDYNVYPYPHIEMELCDRTLCDVKPKPHEILKVAYAIADALSYAHSKGVIHGDLKPTNILFKENTPKLSDWGMGYTPAYSPPEVLRGEKPDEKADIWSFGVVLYELVKGYNPFQGMDDIETMSKVLEFEPDFSNLGILEGIIRKCLQKERDNRFSSMDEIKRELAKINLTNFSKTFSLSKSKRDRVYSASEIISTYVCEGDFKLARDRLNTVKSLNIMPLKIADAMLAVIEIFEKCHTKVTLDFIKRKYEFILDLLKEHKEEFENSENIGILLRKVLLHQCNNVISDDERELIRNVFCKALLEKIKVLAYRSVE